MATALLSFQKNVTTAATAVRLSSTSIVVSDCVVKAKAANTGKIYIGDSTTSSSVGYELAAGDPVNIASLLNRNILPNDLTIDLTDVWIDSSVNGEGVTVLYAVR